MPYQTVGLLDHLRKWELNIEIEPGWETRGNVGFAPKGLVLHHTAIDDDAASVRVVRDGRPGLAGPLSEFVLKKNGTVVVIAAGRANHAGAGGWKWLTGNSTVWGIEAVHRGTTGTPWPNQQLEAYYKLSAALATYSKFKSDFVCGHKEWAPTRKIDPIDLNMNQFRACVQLLIDAENNMPDYPTYPVNAGIIQIDVHRNAEGNVKGYTYWTKDGGIFNFGEGGNYLGRIDVPSSQW